MLGYNLFLYCGNNPIRFSDDEGTFWDIALDVVFTIGSVINVIQNPTSGKAWVALGVDIICMAVPFVSGGGTVVRAASKVDDVVNAQNISKCNTTINAIQTYYPPNDGFIGSAEKITLQEGTLIQRTDSLHGTFVAPAGTPQQMLSLPPDKVGQKTTILQVQKNIEVLAGTVSPWFGQIGCGTQYILGEPVSHLIQNGSIKIME